ncbi:MAG: O-succinylbenzoate-CoA synthase [Bacteriovoracaceae bacterium]|jgi:L-Ala-D/L-Glu epimerase|nr:O-succinylbenzoate-CoA synthase [Bacteriovoracaceae bacterium]
MEIKSVRVRKLYIPFKITFKHSLAEHSDVESIILEIETKKGHIGHGEAIPRVYVTGESVESVFNHLKNNIAPKLLGMFFDTPSELIHWLNSFNEHFPSLSEKDLCVRTAVDLSLLDAMGKEVGENVASFFGGIKRKKPMYSAILSADTPKKIERILKRYRFLMLRQAKLKVGQDHKCDLSNLKLIRKFLGKNAQVRVDANALWDLETAKSRLSDFAELGVISVEQPMPVALKEDYPKLVEFLKGKMHISIDESLCSYEDGKWMIENRGCTIFNLRVSKNGGITNTLRLYHLALQGGIKCQLGAQVGETSILSSAGRLIAGITGDLLFHEGSFGTHLLKKDITNKPLMFGIGGKGATKKLTKKVGLGIKVNQKTLDKFTQESYLIY